MPSREEITSFKAIKVRCHVAELRKTYNGNMTPVIVAKLSNDG